MPIRLRSQICHNRCMRSIINFMTHDALKTMLNRRLFEPLRLKTSNGEVFEIRHPEMATMAKSALIVVHPDADGSPSDKVEYISYLHIASVETLAGAVAKE